MLSGPTSLSVRKEQASLLRRLAHVERRLIEREPIPDRSDDKAQLIEDLQQVYEGAVAADLPRADGERYYPTRLLVAINRARAGERDPVKIVTDTIRRRTEGLDILLGAGLVEWTLEWLVLDASKPYQDLFGRRSIELARARVAEFEREGVPLPGADPGLEARRAAVLLSTAEIESWFADRLADHPEGYALPVVHGAQATLLGVESGRAIVRRSSGTTARPPLRVLAFRIREMAIGRRFTTQTALGYGSQRDTAVLGPLLADLPSVRSRQARSRRSRTRWRRPQAGTSGLIDRARLAAGGGQRHVERSGVRRTLRCHKSSPCVRDDPTTAILVDPARSVNPTPRPPRAK